MASGVEMMVQSMLRAMGFDPAKLQSELQGFMEWTHSTMEDYNSRIAAIEKTSQRVEEKLDLLLFYQEGKVIDYVRQRKLEAGNGEHDNGETRGNGGSPRDVPAQFAGE